MLDESTAQLNMIQLVPVYRFACPSSLPGPWSSILCKCSERGGQRHNADPRHNQLHIDSHRLVRIILFCGCVFPFSVVQSVSAAPMMFDPLRMVGMGGAQEL